jgi:hypothetical protein
MYDVDGADVITNVGIKIPGIHFQDQNTIMTTIENNALNRILNQQANRKNEQCTNIYMRRLSYK